MEYYDFFELPHTLEVNLADLKKNYLAKSKKYHPDFHTLDDEETQSKILMLSSLNNEAYKTLSHFTSRTKYILTSNQQLAAEGENKIPQEFLMEMMDFNERLMDLAFDDDPQAKQELANEIDQIIEDQKSALSNLHTVTFDSYSDQQWNSLKDYYLKNQYLNRLKEKL